MIVYGQAIVSDSSLAQWLATRSIDQLNELRHSDTATQRHNDTGDTCNIGHNAAEDIVWLVSWDMRAIISNQHTMMHIDSTAIVVNKEYNDVE